MFRYPFGEFHTHGSTADQEELQLLLVPAQVPHHFLSTQSVVTHTSARCFPSSTAGQQKEVSAFRA